MGEYTRIYQDRVPADRFVKLLKTASKKGFNAKRKKFVTDPGDFDQVWKDLLGGTVLEDCSRAKRLLNKVNEGFAKVPAGDIVKGDLYSPEAGVICKVKSVEDMRDEVRIIARCSNQTKDDIRVFDKKDLVKKRVR